MKKVLITRSMPEALELAQHIKVLGCLPVIEPLFTVELVSPQCPATGEVQAFIVTSRNAVRAIAAQVDKSVTLYAVGEKTATLARSMGFTRIYTAKGTVDDLIKLILSKINPHKGKVIYFSGEIIKRDIGKVLKEQEIECERIVSYRTVPCLHLT